MRNQTRVTCDGLCNVLWSGPEIVANPDISGIGVLIGFLVTAYLTFFLVVVYYLAGFVEAEFMNEVDTMLLALIAKIWPKTNDHTTRRLQVTLRSSVLMFSDQQAVTGIALLASGYAQLNSGIDSYHWQVLVYLAWFSSLTHLTTLTILRQYFRKNRVARRWRCFFMLVMAIMLGIAILPTGNRSWFTSYTWAGTDASGPGVPALCFFKRVDSRDSCKSFSSHSVATYSMVVSLFVLTSGYLVRLVRLFEKATELIRHWTRTRPGQVFKNMRDYTLQHVRKSKMFFSKICWILGYMFVETSYVLLQASLDVYDSMLWEILWLLFALVWGTTILLSTRSDFEDPDIHENNWAFGQFFPVILLVLPVLNMVEVYYDACNAAEGHSDPEHINNIEELNSSANSLPRLIRIGRWNTNTPTTTYSGAVENLTIVERTEANVQTEGEDIGSVHSRASYNVSLAEPSNTPPENSTNGPSSREGTDSSMPSEYRRFEWYWILNLMTLASASIIIISAFFPLGQTVRLFTYTLRGLAVSIILSFCYTGTFVILSIFHEAIGKILEQRLGISHLMQQILLRYMTWWWVWGVLVAVMTVSSRFWARF